jgi:negative regulator of sigma E activity
VRLAAVVALLAALSGTPASAAAKGPDALLQRAYAADRSVTYVATVHTRVNGASGATEADVKVWHSGGKQRMEYVSGPMAGRVLVDDGTHVYWLQTEDRTAVAAPAGGSPANMALLLRNYKVTAGGVATIAGRRALLLKVSPRKPPGPRRDVWIDSATSVILRTDSYTSDGRLQASTRVVSISFPARLSETLFALPRGWTVTQHSPNAGEKLSIAEASQKIGMPVYQPSVLPAGFHLQGVYLATTGSGIPMVHLRYTDGLNSLSVFQHAYRRGGGMGMGRGMGMGMGRRWRGGRGMMQGEAGDGIGQCQILHGAPGLSLRVYRSDRVYVLIADLPAAELERVASSLPQ